MTHESCFNINIFHLPLDVLEHVLTGLHVRDILSFATTCKTAYDIVYCASFWLLAIEKQWGPQQMIVDSSPIEAFKTLHNRLRWKKKATYVRKFCVKDNVFGISVFHNRIVTGGTRRLSVWDVDTLQNLYGATSSSPIMHLDVNPSRTSVLQLLRTDAFFISDLETLSCISKGSMQANAGHFVRGESTAAVGGSDSRVAVFDVRHPTNNMCTCRTC